MNSYRGRTCHGTLGRSFLLDHIVEVVAAIRTGERLADRLLERRVVGLEVGQKRLEVGAERREAGEGIRSAP